MENVLEKLFGSSARVKIIRLFLQNPSDLFNPKEISGKLKINANLLRREIFLLDKIGFIKHKTASIDTVIKLKKGKLSTQGGPASGWKNKKKKIQGIGLNEMFPFLASLKNLFLDTPVFNKEKLVQSLKNSGNIKLIILSGVFLQKDTLGADLLLVGDGLNRVRAEKALKKAEAEIGREIVFAIFGTKEFLYRFSMYDQFLRDILDYPHEKIMDKIGI